MTTEQVPSTVYQGIAIKYNEKADRWEYEREGVERYAQSLKAAKEAIDKPLPEKRGKFERFTAFMNRYSSSEFKEVTVTSFIEDDYGRIRDAWISYPGSYRGKEREKVGLHSLIANTPENVARIAEHKALTEQIRALEEQCGKITFTKVEPPAGEKGGA